MGDRLQTWGENITNDLTSKIWGLIDDLNVLRYSDRVWEVEQYIIERNGLSEALIKKEISWRHRAKKVWLQAGDMNTRFFFMQQPQLNSGRI